MKRINSKSEIIDLKMPIPVRGLEITHLELITINDIQFVQIPFYHQLSKEDKIKEITNYLLDNISISNLHPESQFLIEAHHLNTRNISCSFNYLYTDPNFLYRDCVKVKVSPTDFKIDALKKLIVNDAVKSIRLDGNQKFNATELELFLKKLEQIGIEKIEYFEEPTLIASESKSILQKYKIPMAIDENFNITDINFYDVFILRPSLIGFNQTKNFIEKAYELNKKVIISSGFEISSGMNALIYLSHYCDQVYKSKIFHGLDTFKFYDQKYFQFSLDENKLSL